MAKLHPRLVALLCLVLMLSACIGEKTPQEVAHSFWGSVISNDANGAVKYSTLTDVNQYDGFDRDWKGLTPTWGRIVIEGEQASIVSRFSDTENPAHDGLTFATFLVRQDDEWKVDYARTGKELRGGALGQLFGQLKRIGESLSSQFNATSDDLGVKMERLGEELEELSGSLGEQASESIEKYSEGLRRSIDELAESARRALKEHEKQLSEEDRRALQEVVADLDQNSDQLSEPSFQSIAHSRETVTAAQQQLNAIESENIGSFKRQWKEWGGEYEADVRKILGELSAVANSVDKK